VQSKKEEIRLAIFVGLVFYCDMVIFDYINELRGLGESGTANSNEKPEPYVNIYYYECCLRLIEAVFCMVKFSVYAGTAYLEEYKLQESMFFYVRVAKFGATAYTFYVGLGRCG
jgi:hypothetical protein